MSGTFLMSIGGGRVPVTVVDEFTLRGHQWVVHPKLGSFAVSHRESGWMVPQSGAETAQQARALAEDKIARQSEGSFQKAMEAIL